MKLDLNYNALVLKARRCLQTMDVVQAARICEDLVKQRKNDPAVLSIMSRIAVEQSRNDEAVKLLERCLALQPKAIEHHLDLAWVLARMGKYIPAIARLEKAQRLQPENLSVIGLLADTQERAGEPAKAKQVLEKLVAAGTENPFMASVWARIALDEKQPEEAVRVLERHVGRGAERYPPSFLFVLAQAYEKLGRLDESFKAYCAANAKPTFKFDLDKAIKDCEDLLIHFNRATLSRLPKPTHETSKPIFIAGRPRSGTTLIEKILDSHPDVAGVGELAHLPGVLENLGFEIGSTLIYPKCIVDLDQDDVNRLSKQYLDLVRKLAPGAKRTVDKNLSNYQMLGPMQILFPHSHIIHIRREPVDNCWAIFVADMSYSWCSDLRTLGITHALYERLMRHWHEALDLPILDVEYEALVDDQEGWTRKILEFCGLEWDERCLRYYETAAKEKSSASAPTLSYNQVRKPIYKTSVGRAQRFEKFLGPLREGIEEGRRIAEGLGRPASSARS